MANPHTYLDRGESRLNPRYLFVSYSHKDKKEVYSTLDMIYQEGINYWYDVELDPGDKWNQRVKKVLGDNNCIGALVFLSFNSISSDAVNKEIDLMLNLQKQKNFRIVFVIIGYNKPKDLYYAVEEETVSKEIVDKFRNLTYEGVYVTLNNAVLEISQNASKWDVLEKHWSNFREVNFSNWSSLNIKGDHYFVLGTYPYDENNASKVIEWKLIYVKDGLLYLISKYCLNFVNLDEIQSVLNGIKQQVEKEYDVVDVCLPPVSVIEEYKEYISINVPTDFADKNRQQMLKLFWVNGKNDDEVYLYNSKNIRVDSNIEKGKINAGLRPMLIIRNQKQEDA